MKERIPALALALVLAMGLSACDNGKNSRMSNDSDILGDERYSTQQHDTGSNQSGKSYRSDGDSGSYYSGSDNDRTDNSRGSDSKNGTDGRGSNSSTRNPALGTMPTATWRHMLENGRVHDRDGFLLDGENAHWA